MSKLGSKNFHTNFQGKICVMSNTNTAAVQRFKAWVSIPWPMGCTQPARMYYATHSHICELCIYYKNFTVL